MLQKYVESGEVQLSALWKTERDYLLEQLRFAPQVVSRPPHHKEPSGGFVKSLENFTTEEDPRELEWLNVPWQEVRIIQPQAYGYAVDWYQKYLLENGLVLPPTAYRIGDIWAVKNGTHRVQAIQKVLRMNEHIALADENNLIAAVSTQPVQNAKIYRLEEIRELR